MSSEGSNIQKRVGLTRRFFLGRCTVTYLTLLLKSKLYGCDNTHMYIYTCILISFRFTRRCNHVIRLGQAQLLEHVLCLDFPLVHSCFVSMSLWSRKDQPLCGETCPYDGHCSHCCYLRERPYLIETWVEYLGCQAVAERYRSEQQDKKRKLCERPVEVEEID